MNIRTQPASAARGLRFWVRLCLTPFIFFICFSFGGVSTCRCEAGAVAFSFGVVSADLMAAPFSSTAKIPCAERSFRPGEGEKKKDPKAGWAFGSGLQVVEFYRRHALGQRGRKISMPAAAMRAWRRAIVTTVGLILLRSRTWSLPMTSTGTRLLQARCPDVACAAAWCLSGRRAQADEPRLQNLRRNPIRERQ